MTATAFDELLRRLVEADVRFVLIGGLALGAWGVVRGTKDVDIVVDPDADNVIRLAEAMVEIGGTVQREDALAGSARSIAALLAEGQRVLVRTTVGALDVVQGLDGVPTYADLLSRAERVEVAGMQLVVCSLQDLRAMKRAAARPRDLVDLADLDAAHGAES
ncbi:MAG: nucleotidyl transferase AbiEii/AbiGii toxin family protein [Actinomycetota bacterium]